MLKKIILFLLAFALCSCGGVSYPQETFNEDIKNLILKESGYECEIYKIDTTVYLDINTEDVVSTNQEVVNNVIKSLQNAVFAITRASLSSDAKIENLVISIFDPDYQVLIRMFQNIDDVKSYFYQRISRGDYETRQLIEFEGPKYAKSVVEDKHFISQEEYVSRLIVAQINSTAKTNPFLAKIILALGIRYNKFEDGKIYISVELPKSKELERFLDDIVSKKLNEYIEKYKLFSIKSAILLFSDNTNYEVCVK